MAAFEEKVRRDLTEFLQHKEALDEHIPECPDVEEKWSLVARAYMPDGAREFQNYPVVSLGWMMLIGMAMAFYWDTDWEKNAARTDFYEKLRDMRGYDNMDEAVVQDLLGYRDEAAEKVTELVAECASRVYSLLSHEHVEPGTEAALGCYIAALHQLYLAGMTMELNALGYHMTPLNQQ
ncbi:MAG: hypothetical protein K2L21_04100 [Muribaculaceae bacterium]|nr:hypothetical protein [Muribaculaceae bacterium]